VEELDLSDDEMKDGVDTVQVVNKKSRRKSALRDSTSSSSSSHNICQAFAQGRCEQGNKCRLKHLVMSNASSDIRFRPQMHQAQPNGRVCHDFGISGRCRLETDASLSIMPPTKTQRMTTLALDTRCTVSMQAVTAHHTMLTGIATVRTMHMAWTADMAVLTGIYQHGRLPEGPRRPCLYPDEQEERSCPLRCLWVLVTHYSASGPALHQGGCMRRWWSLTRSLLTRSAVLQYSKSCMKHMLGHRSVV